MMSTFDEVKQLVVQTLEIDDRTRTLEYSTPLFGSMPELDSLTVVELAMALESKFGFQMDDTDFSGEVFETLGSLTEFVRRSRRSEHPLEV